MMNQGKAYGAKAAEEEIISTAKIERHRLNRNRNTNRNEQKI